MGSAEDHIDYDIIHSHHLHSADDLGNVGVFGDPPIPPRIGDKYQVKLPSLEGKSGKQSTFVVGTDDIDCSIRIYPAVPIYWVNTKENRSYIETGMDGSLGTDINKKPITQASKWYKDESSNGSFHQKQSDNERFKESSIPQNQEAGGCEPLPGSPGICLENTELEGFLLALYIFGKNLRLVEKFLETRKMADILSFYYGKFYRSDEHRRWSQCKKSKSRRCILGHRIFTGWRQHEILSRLLPVTPEDRKASLLEVTKTFSEGITSLETYVLKVKGIVGMKALVEAIGVGNGKLDLTGIVLDRTRANNSLSYHSEIPVGKDFSSLPISAIINLLAGNIRLSKQRSNDLFWEAVWPCLLANGWHSEQPKHKRCITSKQNLVFLVPGVNKFSRRKLTRGHHYFDSVTDVLHKVASDPRLLELEVDGCRGSSLVRNKDYCIPNTKLDDGVKLNNKSFCSSDLMKFTIVDTSSAGGSSSIRQLRCLPVVDSTPVDNTFTHTPSAHSYETGSSSSEEQESVDILMMDHEDDKDKFHCEVSGDGLYYNNEKKILSGHSDHPFPVSESIHVNREDISYSYSTPLHQKATKEKSYQIGGETKDRKPVYLSPISKRRRLAACKYTGAGSDTSNLFTYQLVTQSSCKSLSTNDTKAGPLGQCPGALSTKYFCESTSSVSVALPHSPCSNLIGRNTTEGILHDEKPCTRAMIDLNIPQFSPEFDTGCANNADVDNMYADADGNGNPVTDGVHHLEFVNAICVDANMNRNCPAEREHQCGGPYGICVASNANGDCNTGRVQLSEDTDGLRQVNEVGTEHLDTTNLRRTSTRYRPPTTKVLESLESGFFSLKKERRSRSSRSGKLRTFRARKRCFETSVSHAYLKPDSCALEIRDTMS